MKPFVPPILQQDPLNLPTKDLDGVSLSREYLYVTKKVCIYFDTPP